MGCVMKKIMGVILLWVLLILVTDIGDDMAVVQDNGDTDIAIID